MSDWLMKTIRGEARRLLEMAADDDELRLDLRALAQEILAATEIPGPAASFPEIEPATDSQHPPEEAAGPLHALTFGRSPPAASRSATTPGQGGKRESAEDGLTSLATRCRRKAEVARWVAASQRRVDRDTDVLGGPDLPEQQQTGWAEALTNAFHWANARTATEPTGFAMLDDLAGCFETLVESLALVQETQGRGKGFEQALKYLAEAQSAARKALQRLGIDHDPDQEEIYEWIRSTAAQRRIYLGRHMRADDLADPAGWSSLLTRVEEARSSGQKTPLDASRIDRIRQLSTRISEGKQEEKDWPDLMEAVAGLVDDGMPPSSRELRELLMPIIDDAPELDDPPRGFRLVLREVDRYLATRLLPVETSLHHEPAAEVKGVARLLSGKCVILIGGIQRREAQQALKRAFNLSSLVWIETKEHQSVETFEPMIVRPEVALVLLAIRWSSHGFGEVRHVCERHGKPLVRLPGGYSPNQVAAQILAQVSEQLHE